MDWVVYIFGGAGIYLLCILVTNAAYNCLYDFKKEQKSLLKCVNENNFLPKLIKKIFWRKTIKTLISNIDYILVGYTRDLIYWKINYNFWIRAALFSLINTLFIFAVKNYSVLMALFKQEKNNLYKFVKESLELIIDGVAWIEANKMLVAIVLVLLLTGILAKYKNVFDDMLREKRKSDIEKMLEFNLLIYKKSPFK